MGKNDLMNIGHVYGKMLDNIPVISEKAPGMQKFSKNKGKGAKSLTKDVKVEIADKDTTGPEGSDGFKPASIDVHNLSKKQKQDNNYDIDRFSYCGCGDEDEEEISTAEREKIKKVTKESINTFMKKHKSSFDKLYEAAIGNDSPDDLNELGIETDGGFDDMEGDDMGDELGDDMEGEDQVTLTLDRTTAQALCDAIQAVLGGEEDLGDELGDELPDEDFGGEDDSLENPFGDEDEEVMGHAVKGAKPPQQLTGKSNKVQASGYNASGGKAQSGYTDTVEAGKPLGKNVNYGKNNKVGNLKQGQQLFK